MNIARIERELRKARRSIGIARYELIKAAEESSFNMFEPLCRRAETIFSKNQQLIDIIEDLLQEDNDANK